MKHVGWDSHTQWEMNDFSMTLGQRDRMPPSLQLEPKTDNCRLLAAPFSDPMSRFHQGGPFGFSWLQIIEWLVWDSSTLLSLPSLIVDIVLHICSSTDISGTVQGLHWNFAGEIRIQSPGDSDSPYFKMCDIFRWMLSASLQSLVISFWEGAWGRADSPRWLCGWR